MAKRTGRKSATAPARFLGKRRFGHFSEPVYRPVPNLQFLFFKPVFAHFSP